MYLDSLPWRESIIWNDESRPASRAVILHFNHISRGKSAKNLGELTCLVTASLTTLAESGAVDPKLLGALRVHLDWIHYKLWARSGWRSACVCWTMAKRRMCRPA